jgi:uncharacterized protein YcfJ
MRPLMIALVASLTLPAFAEGFTDYAKVRNVEPQYERVNTPRRECTSEWVNERSVRQEDRSYGGAVVGAIAGGLIGNQIGGGRGKEAATALGAVVGAMTGDRLDNRDRNVVVEESPREVKRCRTVDDVHTRITGYRVTYDYRGQRFTTFMPNDPGSELRVRVSVEPVIQ